MQCTNCIGEVAFDYAGRVKVVRPGSSSASKVETQLKNAREFVRLRWRHVTDCPEVGSHPNAVDLARCNCGLKIALLDLGATDL